MDSSGARTSRCQALSDVRLHDLIRVGGWVTGQEKSPITELGGREECSLPSGSEVLASSVTHEFVFHAPLLFGVIFRG